jgi:hypothetical protein
MFTIGCEIAIAKELVARGIHRAARSQESRKAYQPMCRRIDEGDNTLEARAQGCHAQSESFDATPDVIDA